MLAALNTEGQTIIKAKKSRDHTEILFKDLGIPIKITKKINYDFITISRFRYELINYVRYDFCRNVFFHDSSSN